MFAQKTFLSKLIRLLVDNEKFPAFSEAIKFYKDTEKGCEVMCRIVEEYAEEYAEKCVTAYKVESAQSLFTSVNNFMRKCNDTLETACESSGATVEEYYKAKELLEKAG